MSGVRHGMSRTPEWEAWRAMLKRCYKPNTRNYDRYGGRGIGVCDRWRESFENFLADMGRRPSNKHSLHRKDNDGHYEPGNCEWALPVVQANNRGRPRRGVVRRPRLAPPGSRPANFRDLTGEVFGRWEVVRHHGSAPGITGGAVWWCKCECGTERPVKATSLQTGRSRSCGCLHKEVVGAHARTRLRTVNTKHGKSRSREYAAWNQMIQRCTNPKNPTYARYGAKGVKVCESWQGSSGFDAFLADMGPCPSESHTLDRTDPSGHYEPSNCRWLPAAKQSANRKHVRRFPHRGEMLTIPELSSRTGIKVGTLRFRLVQMGWDVERATSQDPSQYHHKTTAEA